MTITIEDLILPTAYQEVKVSAGETILYCHEVLYEDPPEVTMGVFEGAIGIAIDAILDNSTEHRHVAELCEHARCIADARAAYELQMFTDQDVQYLTYIGMQRGSFNGTDSIHARRTASLHQLEQATKDRYS